MPKHKSQQVLAKKKAAAKVDKDPASLVRCEVQLEHGDWISPTSCQVFYIDEAAKFPDLDFEFRSDAEGPFDWAWEVKWIAKSCPQATGKDRFTPKGGVATFIERGAFSSNDKKWRATFGGKVLGGEVTVTVKASGVTLRRKAYILAKNPPKDSIVAELEKYSSLRQREVRLAKLIFKQESSYRQHYSDCMPLVSFDKGYGLGQATSPAPSFEQVWNWRKHVEYILCAVLPEKVSFAKSYLKSHEYSDDVLDMETLVYYNGANRHYYVWSDSAKAWVVNEEVLCDPKESNKGWDMTAKSNEKKTLEDLRNGKGSKPMYTGRCYAEHVKSSN
jgi:hypothetical protein